MASDRSDDSEQRPGEPIRWVARVGRRLSPTAGAAPARDPQDLAGLAAQAGEAARQSARLAGGAARSAALAKLTVDRLGAEPLEQARATAGEIADAAEQAVGASTEARDRAALVELAVQGERAPRAPGASPSQHDAEPGPGARTPAQNPETR